MVASGLDEKIFELYFFFPFPNPLPPIELLCYCSVLTQHDILLERKLSSEIRLHCFERSLMPGKSDPPIQFPETGRSHTPLFYT